MVKGTMAVSLLSVVVIVLFFVMCYLMSNVNPPPLKNDDTREEHRSNELQFENVIFDDVPPPGDMPQYGLEKVEVDSVELVTPIEPTESEQQVTIGNYSLWRFTTRKVIPPLWPRTTAPSVIPTNTPTKQVTSNNTHGLDKKEKEQSEALPIKGHRRSISGLKNDDDKPAFVILKILDTSGESRIEIKLGHENSSKRRKNRDNKSKNKFKFSMSLPNNNDQIKKRVLARNTIISIMPNDSIIIDEYERVISDGKKKPKEIMKIEEKVANDIKSMIGIPNVTNRTIRNITDYEDVLFTKTSDNTGIVTTSIVTSRDVTYEDTFLNNDVGLTTDKDIAKNVTNTGETETEPRSTLKMDVVYPTTSVAVTTENQEYSIIPTLSIFQSEDVSNNDISNTFLDDFTSVKNATEVFKAVANVSFDDNVSKTTPVNEQDINLIADVSVLMDNPSSVSDLPIANVESFDLLSKLDALSENSTLTSIESISHENSSDSTTNIAITKGNATVLTTILTFQDELQRATISNVAIQNDNSILLATNHNEDLALTTADMTVPNENANVENKTRNNLV
ncbi:uncharacterized protein LOC113500886 isoform X2 [Trichoplusia ni]|uniref:Uncharacterized protein LOC113500886 isoform X2 n=1 Tax=Trichoplusia ni TaxID=7111 RepID=A0A7E5WBT5_TRINI|nr:uncharacterized protein LOC113500886 isoform X2 [Trichoplusia ni]